MFKITKKYILPSLAMVFSFIFTTVKAQCPVCTAAVIGGVGLARWLKIDDTITGIWAGGLIVSTSIWTINWLKTKKWDFKTSGFTIPIAYYISVIVPLYFYEIIGHPQNIFWQTDKFLLGIIFGSVFFYAALLRYYQIKKKNNNHALFPFQHIVMSVGSLIILSIIFYFLTKNIS